MLYRQWELWLLLWDRDAALNILAELLYVHGLELLKLAWWRSELHVGTTNTGRFGRMRNGITEDTMIHLDSVHEERCVCILRQCVGRLDCSRMC